MFSSLFKKNILIIRKSFFRKKIYTGILAKFLFSVNASKGVWTVGNIGREQGSIWLALATAYLFYPTLYYIGDDTMWIFLMVIASSLSFDTFSKQWRLKPKKKRSFVRRMTVLGLALMLYFIVIGSYLYFNAVITDSEGEEIKLSEAVQHFLTSPIWTDLKVYSW